MSSEKPKKLRKCFQATWLFNGEGDIGIGVTWIMTTKLPIVKSPKWIWLILFSQEIFVFDNLERFGLEYGPIRPSVI